MFGWGESELEWTIMSQIIILGCIMSMKRNAINSFSLKMRFASLIKENPIFPFLKPINIFFKSSTSFVLIYNLTKNSSKPIHIYFLCSDLQDAITIEVLILYNYRPNFLPLYAMLLWLIFFIIFNFNFFLCVLLKEIVEGFSFSPF